MSIGLEKVELVRIPGTLFVRIDRELDFSRLTVLMARKRPSTGETSWLGTLGWTDAAESLALSVRRMDALGDGETTYLVLPDTVTESIEPEDVLLIICREQQWQGFFRWGETVAVAPTTPASEAESPSNIPVADVGQREAIDTHIVAAETGTAPETAVPGPFVGAVDDAGTFEAVGAPVEDLQEEVEDFQIVAKTTFEAEDTPVAATEDEDADTETTRSGAAPAFDDIPVKLPVDLPANPLVDTPALAMPEPGFHTLAETGEISKSDEPASEEAASEEVAASIEQLDGARPGYIPPLDPFGSPADAFGGDDIVDLVSMPPEPSTVDATAPDSALQSASEKTLNPASTLLRGGAKASGEPAMAAVTRADSSDVTVLERTDVSVAESLPVELPSMEAVSTGMVHDDEVLDDEVGLDDKAVSDVDLFGDSPRPPDFPTVPPLAEQSDEGVFDDDRGREARQANKISKRTLTLAGGALVGVAALALLVAGPFGADPDESAFEVPTRIAEREPVPEPAAVQPDPVAPRTSASGDPADAAPAVSELAVSELSNSETADSGGAEDFAVASEATAPEDDVAERSLDAEIAAETVAFTDTVDDVMPLEPLDPLADAEPDADGGITTAESDVVEADEAETRPAEVDVAEVDNADSVTVESAATDADTLSTAAETPTADFSPALQPLSDPEFFSSRLPEPIEEVAAEEALPETEPEPVQQESTRPAEVVAEAPPQEVPVPAQPVVPAYDPRVVNQAQLDLLYLGYQRSDITGEMDAPTQQALTSFKRDFAIPEATPLSVILANQIAEARRQAERREAERREAERREAERVRLAAIAAAEPEPDVIVDAEVIQRAQVEYPRRALTRGNVPDKVIVTVEFTVDEQGAVRNAVVNAVEPQPPLENSFRRAAVAAVESQSFTPRTVNGVETASEGMIQRITFQK